MSLFGQKSKNLPESFPRPGDHFSLLKIFGKKWPLITNQMRICNVQVPPDYTMSPEYLVAARQAKTIGRNIFINQPIRTKEGLSTPKKGDGGLRRFGDITMKQCDPLRACKEFLLLSRA